jgi:hypothetical protein
VRVYRASGLGGCIKAQVAAQLGFTALDTSKKMENMAREGALHEGAVIASLGTVTDMQQEVTIPILRDVRIVGHIDGMWGGGVLEIKSMGKDAFKAWKEKRWETPGLVQKYKWQVSCYMHALNMPLRFIVKCRDSGEIDERYTDEPFYGMDEIMARVLEIEKWVRRGELPDECSVAQYPCPFYYLEQQKSLEIMEDEVLDDLVQMLEDARVAEKAAKARVKAARDSVEESLGDREKVETEKSKVTRYDTKRKSLDADKMKGDGIDVDKYYVETLYQNVRVTVKGGKDGGTDEPGGDSGGTTSDRGTMAQHMGESDESGRDAEGADER